MLSSSNIRTINRQIENELRNASMALNSDEERLAALERVAKLKSLLNPQETQACDPNQIADLVIQKLTTPRKSGLEVILEMMAVNR